MGNIAPVFFMGGNREDIQRNRQRGERDAECGSRFPPGLPAWLSVGAGSPVAMAARPGQGLIDIVIGP